ncbi:ChrR family anti-sigma-E factor [Pseudochelatococcus lubricantis]|uniref:ChrR family anti-sigma-E factor n=1 Tax=Pseudochelatococcus lubricantis TaxID=1538102 RepID=UPI0035EA73B0
MTIAHHPTDETLLRYATGTLAAGPAIVIAAHLAVCPLCRNRLRTFEALGGAVLDETPATALAPTALAAALTRIDAEAAPAPSGRHAGPSAARPSPVTRDGLRLPEALAGCDIGAWRWLGPGVRMSRISTPREPDASIMLLKVGPGRKLPEHGHSGTEFTHVLSGSFSDVLGRFGPGDLAEVDDEVEHQPIVDRDGECICLVALDGRMRLSGLFGRIVQPLFGF